MRESAVVRPSFKRNRPWLTASVLLVVLVAACTRAASTSPDSTVVPDPSTAATSGPLASPNDGASDSTASAFAPAPSGEAAWSRVTAPFGDPSDATRVDGVVAWQSRLVAFGRARAPGRNPYNELAAVFLSDDGESWRTVPIGTGVGPADTSEISLLAAGARGIVLFGDTCCGVEEPATWFSADAETWERVPFPSSSVDGPQLAAARATADGFVAVGSEGGRAAIWTTNDGRTWTVVGSADARLGTGAIGDVAPVNGRWLAAGYQDDGDTYDGALWESPDGLHWQRLPADELFQGELDTAFGRLYATPGGVLVIGNEGPHAERVRCEQLLGRTASVASIDPPETAISCGWGIETHWWSSDGRSWQRLPSLFPLPGEPPLTGPGPIEFRLITIGGPGLLNLGEDRGGGVHLWASPDGRDWQDEGAMGLRLNQDLPSGIAVLDGRIIAVGDAWDGSASAPGEPAVWFRSGL